MNDAKDTNRKPQPLMTQIIRPQCPVCGKPAYSHSGTHPQCMAKVYGVKKKT
jgi:hypothetical protein